MSANVETMFYVGRETPWHGLGVQVEETVNSKEAVKLAGLDWKVIQSNVYDDLGRKVENYNVNIRDTDRKILGIVTNQYKIVQNEEAFEFTDHLLGEGITYETAGSLSTGKRVWLLVKMPKQIITDEEYSPYLVFTNSHDGTGAIKACITPIRVVCQNTLNLALRGAKRHWSCCHKGDINSKLEEAKETILNSRKYLKNLSEEFEELKLQKLTDDKVIRYLDYLLPTKISMTERMRKNNQIMKNEIMNRYLNAPDLRDIEKSSYRFLNAVSDYATHGTPLRKTINLQENRFMKTIDGNKMIDEAYKIVLSA